MKLRPLLLIVGLALPVGGCLDRPLVMQGVVVRSDATAGTVVVKDERQPHPETVFSLDGCDIGAQPGPGDTVRVAYRTGERGPRAIRLMNLTRQSELAGKGGSAGH
jgi:hypothetical protein